VAWLAALVHAGAEEDRVPAEVVRAPDVCCQLRQSGHNSPESGLSWRALVSRATHPGDIPPIMYLRLAFNHMMSQLLTH
jgi:hypothetical protein